MRERTNQIVVMLNDKEYRKLLKSVEKAGNSKAEYVRRLIMNHEIKERPPKEYAQMVYEMAKIGNNINQIAHKANATNFAAAGDAQKAVLLMKKCWNLIKDLG